MESGAHSPARTATGAPSPSIRCALVLSERSNEPALAWVALVVGLPPFIVAWRDDERSTAPVPSALSSYMERKALECVASLSSPRHSGPRRVREESSGGSPQKKPDDSLRTALKCALRRALALFSARFPDWWHSKPVSPSPSARTIVSGVLGMPRLPPTDLCVDFDRALCSAPHFGIFSPGAAAVALASRVGGDGAASPSAAAAASVIQRQLQRVVKSSPLYVDSAAGAGVRDDEIAVPRCLPMFPPPEPCSSPMLLASADTISAMSPL